MPILRQMWFNIHTSIFQSHPYRATASSRWYLCANRKKATTLFWTEEFQKVTSFLTNNQKVLLSENHLEQATLFLFKKSASLRFEELNRSSISPPLCPAGWAPLHTAWPEHLWAAALYPRDFKFPGTCTVKRTLQFQKQNKMHLCQQHKHLHKRQH